MRTWESRHFPAARDLRRRRRRQVSRPAPYARKIAGKRRTSRTLSSGLPGDEDDGLRALEAFRRLEKLFLRGHDDRDSPPLFARADDRDAEVRRQPLEPRQEREHLVVRLRFPEAVSSACVGRGNEKGEDGGSGNGEAA